MTTYLFETVTDGQAASFDGAADSLMVLQPQESAVTFVVATDEATGRITLTSGFSGRSVVFGPGAAGEAVQVADGSLLVLPGPAASQISGGSANDALYGGGGADTLNGAAGNDVLCGGTRGDVLSGGSGSDTFLVRRGDSGTLVSDRDSILDWTSDDKLVFTGLSVTSSNYLEASAATYGDALALANGAVGSGATDVVVVSIGSDVAVFADTAGDNGAADEAVVLVGCGLGDIGFVNLSAASPSPPTPAPPSPSQPAPPTSSSGLAAGTVIFEQLTAAQALAYNAAVNDLQFTTPGSAYSSTLVFFEPGGTVQVISGAQSPNRVLVFGPGIYGESGFLVSGRVAIGTPGDDLLAGGHLQDSLFTGPGNDTLSGGGATFDRLFGGAGADLFVGSGVVSNPSISADLVGDWEVIDRITFGGPTAGTAANYVELATASFAEAEARIRNGAADFVAYQNSDFGGPTVHIWADAYGDNTVTGHILLSATLASVDFGNIVASPRLIFPGLAALPGALTAAPAPATYVGFPLERASGLNVRGDMFATQLGDLRTGEIEFQTSTGFGVRADNGVSVSISGSGFTYREDAKAIYDIPTGTVSSISLNSVNLAVNASVFGITPSTVFRWITEGAVEEALQTLLSGSNNVTGDNGADQLRGLSGADTMLGMGGNDTLWGGDGNDQLHAGYILSSGTVPVTGSTYLRGEEGDDWISGGTGFDDINGNMGNDTIGGGPGDDWVLGGKDQDLLYGDDGNDLVYGNLGSDTCDGGAGADTIRGGQAEDILRGGAGGDYLSGDRGDDTVTGGAGADRFHTFGDAGLDRVTDFSAAEGDRVMLDPGTQYSVAQVGADTVITMVGGGQMVLVGVQLASLPTGWIFEGV